MLGIAGDSAAGKTTLTRGIVAALGADRATAICVDDYHRYDRQERRDVPFTVLDPDCNYVEIIEQHLQLLALGRPILKPVYDHSTGSLVRPVLVEPRDFVIVEGLLPLHTKLARACFDITVYLDPPEEIRRKLEAAARLRGARLHAASRCCASLTAGSPIRPPLSGPSGNGPTSASGSRPSPGAAPRTARRCRPRSCSARPSSIRTCPGCSPTTTGVPCT